MTNEQINSKLEAMKEYLDLLEEYQKHSFEEVAANPMLRGAIERYLELSLEAIISVCEIIISEKKMKKPDTYKGVILVLAKAGVLPQEFAKRLAPAAGFRNILVHAYDKIDLKRMHEFLQENLGDFDEFAQYVAEYMNVKSPSRQA